MTAVDLLLKSMTARIKDAPGEELIIQKSDALALVECITMLRAALRRREEPS